MITEAALEHELYPASLTSSNNMLFVGLIKQPPHTYFTLYRALHNRGLIKSNHFHLVLKGLVAMVPAPG